MKINKLADVEKTPVQMDGAVNAFKQVPISKNDGTPSYSFRVFTLEPEGHTPYHNHPYEHLNYIIEGEGYIRKSDDEKVPIKKGDFILMEPNEQHQYINASVESNFVMICAVPKEFE